MIFIFTKSFRVITDLNNKTMSIQYINKKPSLRMTFSGVIFNLNVPTRFACLVRNFSDACLRTAFVLQAIKPLVGFIAFRLWREA